MPTKFSLKDIKEFQERAAIVLERGKLRYNCGLCYEISHALAEEAYGGFDTAYDIMREMYDCDDNFYGCSGEMTETRIMVLIFITTVSAKELLEMANA